MKHFSYPFALVNNQTVSPIINPTENDYDCDFAIYWFLAKWIYIVLVFSNFFTFICGSCLWHTIGITMGIQFLTFIPFLHNWVPSCLSHFLYDMQISYGKHILPWPAIGVLFGYTENFDDGTTNYRFNRGGFQNFNFLMNGGEMIVIWIGLMLTIPFMALTRLIFYKNTDVYWYESRWRWEIMVKGFILAYMPILITSLLNITNYRFDKLIDKFSFIASFIGLIICIGGYGAIIGMTMWFKSMP